jgi:hypothetical protein
MENTIMSSKNEQASTEGYQRGLDAKSSIEASVLSPKGTFPAKVARVIDPYKLVINRGLINGIREDQRMLVYCVDNEEIKDPDTGKSLGFLELVRGSGRIIFVQEEISILESDQIFEGYRKIPISPFSGSFLSSQLSKLQDYRESLGETFKGTLKPFDNPQVGDLVKPI